jgi:hypothetical protein
MGEPDRVTYVQVSFRPPDQDESRSGYQRAQQAWEEKTIGEFMWYDRLGLVVEISRVGKVLGWRQDDTPASPGRQGLVVTKPDRDR